MPVDQIIMQRDGNNFAHGSLAARLMACNGDMGQMRSLSVLRRDEWETYDQTVVQVAQEQFGFIADLMNAGLSYDIPNPLGTMNLVWDRISDMDPAQVDMTGESEDVKDRLIYEQDSVPIPIVHKGFSLNIRHLEASRTQGLPLDVTHAQVATRTVVKTIEDLAIKGSFSTGTIAGGGGGTLYGITNYPYRNTFSLTGPWTSATPTQIFDDVNSMIQAAQDDFMYGPYKLYVPSNNRQKLDEDYEQTTSTGKTIKERLLQLDGLTGIETNHFLPANNVVLVQMSSDVIEVIDGIQPMLIEWADKGGMVFNYKVIAIMPIRNKRDGEDHNGIVHGVG